MSGTGGRCAREGGTDHLHALRHPSTRWCPQEAPCHQLSRAPDAFDALSRPDAESGTKCRLAVQGATIVEGTSETSAPETTGDEHWDGEERRRAGRRDGRCSRVATARSEDLEGKHAVTIQECDELTAGRQPGGRRLRAAACLASEGVVRGLGCRSLLDLVEVLLDRVSASVEFWVVGR